MQKKNQALQDLDIVQDEVAKRLEGWERAAVIVGSAYSKAFTNYRDALGARAAAEALGTQVMFSIFAVVTAGGLSWLSDAGKLVAMTQTAEDVLQSAASEALSGVGPVAVGQSPSELNVARAEDPLVYQNDIVKNVKDVKIKALDFFATKKREWRATPDSAWDGFDVEGLAAERVRWAQSAEALGTDG